MKSKNLVICFLISILFNILICNFNTLRSLSFHSESLKVLVDDNDSNLFHVLLDEEKTIRNIYIDGFLFNSSYDNKQDSKKPITFNLIVSDEGNYFEYSFLDHTITPSFDRTKYIFISSMGKIKSISIKIHENEDFKESCINEVTINKTVPFSFNLFWFLFVFISLFLFSNLTIFANENFKFFGNHTNEKNLELLYLLAVIIIFIGKPFLSGVVGGETTTQYHLLTDALLNGHYYLDIPVSPDLLALENPYDTHLRNSVCYGNYAWDTAFFNGKYYCYFGIIPALLVFLPFRFIFGVHLPIEFAICIFGILYIYSSFLFIKSLIKRVNSNISTKTIMLMHMIFVLASGVTHAYMGNYFYSLPILSGLCFSLLGLYFWLSYDNYGEINYKRIAFGSFCISLIAGCRPQLLIIAFSFPVIFSKLIFKDKKQTINLILSFILPMIPFAIFMMQYNYYRFGSILDFGANYNLTEDDMTHRGFYLDRIPLGVYTFLFEPANIKLKFPFIFTSDILTDYQGIIIKDENFGGLFFNFPLLLISIFILVKNYKNIELNKFSLFCVISALILVILDIEVAGMVGSRYKMDFSWLFCANLVLVILSCKRKITIEKINSILIISLYFNIIYVFCVFLALSRSRYLLQSFIQFW